MSKKSNKSKRKHYTLIMLLYFLLASVVIMTAFGWVIMFLWNAILPSVVGVKSLSFWKAIGLLILFSILLGAFRTWRDARKSH